MSEQTTDPRYRFGILLTTLLVLFVGSGLLDYTQRFLPPKMVIGAAALLLIVVLLAAIVNVTGSRRSVPAHMVRGLVIVTALALLLGAVLDNLGVILVARALAILSIGYVVTVVIEYLVKARRVNTDMICASICVYLLLGVLWALGYSLLFFLEPGSFAEGYNLATFGQRALTGELYYSLVTLTTLGYGDVAPLSTAARMAAALEAVIGQIYIVVLVAKLVGLHVAQMGEE